jgi:glycosyltransferase involved in cell wall biosynthesis
MRLLHLYSGNLYGGIERVLLTLARAAEYRAGAGVEQRFALFFDGRLARELRETEAHVDVLGTAAVSRPWRLLRARRALAGSLEEWRPDVVLAHSPWAVAAGGPAVEQAGVCRALWLHNPPTRSPWPDGWALRRSLDLVLANSRYTSEASVGLVHVDDWLYPPVPPPHEAVALTREAVRLQLGASPEDVVILQASRIERWKGLHDHVAALAALRQVAGWMLWIAGAPQRRAERAFFDELRAVTTREGIGDRVRWLGHRTDVPALMAAADIYCQPNLEPEPFGVAIVEAMSAGRPVITTPAGGLSDLVEGRCGLVPAAGDQPALISALRELVSSAPLRQQLGAGGRELAYSLCDPRQQMDTLFGMLARASSAAGVRA